MRFNVNYAEENNVPPSTIAGINQLPYPEKREVYTRLIPSILLEHLNIDPSLKDADGNELIALKCSLSSPSVEMSLNHQIGFPDPVLYGHLADTLNGQIHVLLYILNDPDSPRFNVDRLPDGTPTKFGTHSRNIQAEVAAMKAGLAPGQIRRGLRMLSHAVEGFEIFIQSLQHNLYFVEPLYYHNAIIFERYGFAYQKGNRLMRRIQSGFSDGGEFLTQLDGSNPFRKLEAANSIRLRSWAIHDGILGEPFQNVTMYKQIGKSANVVTCPDCSW
ncbi:MAG: hypothetical protein ACNA8H_04280 [Anaerolineales bacterium]